jgi:S-adenosylmethionine uptake transporter
MCQSGQGERFALKNSIDQKKINIFGAIFMSLAMFGYVSNDTIIKYFASDLPIAQVIFIRGLFVIILITLFCWKKGAFNQSIDRQDWPLVLLRSLADVCATSLFLTALFNMPLANASAILQTLPLTVTLLGAVILGERFGVYRAFAIFFGFVGVLMIIKPGSSGFNNFSLFAIAAVLFITLREIITRQITSRSSTLLISLITAISIAFIGGIGGLFTQNWVVVPFTTIVGLLAASVFIFIAYYFSIPAMQFGEISFVSPFRFTLMIWAVAFGFFFFDEIPDKFTILGLLIVIAAGIFTYFRESYSTQIKRQETFYD